jgi:hypothetical protein
MPTLAIPKDALDSPVISARVTFFNDGVGACSYDAGRASAVGNTAYSLLIDGTASTFTCSLSEKFPLKAGLMFVRFWCMDFRNRKS